MSDPKSISMKLAKWGKEEMNFPSMRQKPLEKLSKELLPACKGSVMISMWEEVITRVKSKSNAENIRNNVKLSELNAEQEKQSSEVEEKNRKLISLTKDIESLELQLKKFKEDAQEVNLRFANAEIKEKQIQMKSCMYQNYCEYLNLKTSLLKSFTKWIEELCAAYFKNQIESDENPNIQCLQEVGKLCQFFLSASHSDDVNKSNSTNFYMMVGKLVKKYPPSLIVLSLLELTDSSTSKVKREEQEVDCTNDIRQLQENLIGEEFLGDDQGKLASVETMLQRWDLECVNSYTQSLKSRRNGDNMLLHIEIGRNAIITELRKQYELVPSTLQLAIENLDAEMELASMQGCLRSFQSSTARLQRDIQVKTETRDRLFGVKKKIDSFAETLAECQHEIIQITKHNSAVKSKVVERQSQVLGVGKDKVCSKKLEFSQTCASLKTALSSRLTAFSHADVSKLSYINLRDDTSLQLDELSIYRGLNTSMKAGGMAYQKMAHSLMIHSHTSPSAIMQKIIHAKKEIDAADDMQDGSLIMERSAEEKKRLDELAAVAAASIKKQVDYMGLKFKDGVKKVKSAQEQLDALNRMIEICQSFEEWNRKMENV